MSAFFEGMPDLVAALKAIPGCLGVETALTGTRKHVIFAWFADKAAALRWYYSDIHQQVIRMLAGDEVVHHPLHDVPDDSGPIMAIAALTLPEGKTVTGAESMRVAQISIELYRPLTGGYAIGGRFAPEGFQTSS